MERGKDKELGKAGESLEDILARLQSHVGARTEAAFKTAAHPRDPVSTPRPPSSSPKRVTPVRAPDAIPETPAASALETDDEDPGRYEGHLAEFPVFILDKRRRGVAGRDPLVYSDTIRGPGDEPVPRRWEAWPGRLGFGGPSTAELFYELVQLYVEQGSVSDHIHFRTINALYRRLHPGAPNPDRKDYDRVRRDLDILCGYRFVCENAFWDREKRAYVHMREWSLFTGWTGYTRMPARGGASYPYQEELPFGAVGVSPILRTIAKNRGLFCIGFESKLFRGLKPLEQRLAVYLAKMFVSQSTHKRFVDELAAALPIQVAEPKILRLSLKRAAQGILDAQVPILKSFNLERSADGRWLIVFHRARRPRQDYGIPGYAAGEFLPGLLLLVDELVEFTKSPQSRPWFTNCVRALGVDVSHFCFAQLKEACTIHEVRDRGALLTKIFEDKAGALGRTLH